MQCSLLIGNPVTQNRVVSVIHPILNGVTIMRYITIILLSVMVFSPAPVIASDENQGKFGISLDNPLGLLANPVNPGRLTVRKLLDEDTVIYAGVGLTFSQNSHNSTAASIANPTSSSSDRYSLVSGVRRFLSRDNLSTFMDLELSGFYSENRGSGPANGGFNQSSYTRGITLMPAYGVEYFFSPNVSIEAKAGIPLNYFKGSVSASSGVSQTTTSITSKSIDFPRFITAITYYW